VVEVRVLCWEVRVEWLMAGSRRRSEVAVATSAVPSALLPKVLPDLGFISDIEVVVLVVGSVQVISGTGCAVLVWRYDLRGNGQEGGKQKQKQLQMEPRGLLTLGMFRQL